MQFERELDFTGEDVELFATASGDRNPLHGDREFAASTAFGAPVVHGSLIAIAMLGALPDEALAQLRSLQVSFSGAVLQETAASLRVTATEREPRAWEIRLAGRGRTMARVLTRPGDELRPAPTTLAALSDSPSRPMRTTPAEPGARELSAGYLVHGEYASAPELDLLARRFGAGALDPRLLEGLAWASYVVGMELPGLRSLFAGLALAVDDARAAEDSLQTLVVRDHDERTGQLTIEGALAAPSAGGVVLARIECFALPSATPPDRTALGLERTHQPNRGPVVVAGGSRGFGASLTLALLALGYEVHVAYASSVGQAEELVRLAGAHAPRLHMTQIDVGDPNAVQQLVGALAADGRSLAGLALNAAPPPLAMSVTPESAAGLADYIATSLRLVAVPLGALLPLLDEQHGWVLFCSSAALTHPPRDWPHYVSAKAAVEGLALWVATTKSSVRTLVLRPPKMRTAMTSTPSGRIGAESPDTVAIWTAELLVGGTLAPGLTTLEPTPEELTKGPRQQRTAG